MHHFFFLAWLVQRCVSYLGTALTPIEELNEHKLRPRAVISKKDGSHPKRTEGGPTDRSRRAAPTTRTSTRKNRAPSRKMEDRKAAAPEETSDGYESEEDTNRQLFDNGNNTSEHEEVEHFEYEFGGPAGALLTTLALPDVTLLLTASASAGSIAPFISNLLHPLAAGSPSDGMFTRLLNNPVLFPGCQDGFSTLLKCMGGVLGWFLFQVVLERVLPCEIVQGAPLKGSPTGERLSYRINGHLAFWTTMLVVSVGWPSYVDVTLPNGATKSMLQFGMAPLGLLYDYHAELALATILLCVVLSAYLYLRSADPTLLRAEGAIPAMPPTTFSWAESSIPAGAALIGRNSASSVPD